MKVLPLTLMRSKCKAFKSCFQPLLQAWVEERKLQRTELRPRKGEIHLFTLHYLSFANKTQMSGGEGRAELPLTKHLHNEVLLNLNDHIGSFVQQVQKMSEVKVVGEGFIAAFIF